MQPFITSTIQRAVEEANARAWEETSYLRDELLELSWKIDDLEQYSRRDNIKITGLEDKAPESPSASSDTNRIVIDTCKLMDVDITENDISTSHWLPGKKPMLIAKFTRRDIKKRIMQSKKKLKKSDPIIYEDLTVPRLRLLREVKKTNGLKRVFTREGVIHCLMETEGRDIRVKIKRPEDLIQIGWNDDDIRSIYNIFK